MNNLLSHKVSVSIDRLKMFCPEDDKYYVCYSGGKDSDVLRILCDLANVPHELHYNLTTADAPETVNYVKSLGNVTIEKARYSDGTHKTMWNLIPKHKIPPTRQHRYCCQELKEFGGKGRLKVVGVRWSESRSRSLNSGLVSISGKPVKVRKFLDTNDINYETNNKKGVILNYDNSESRRAVEFCYRTTTTLISPIIDWGDNDVWEFLHYYGCSSNPLYSCGFKRVGCIGCPLSTAKNMKREFSLFPKFRDNYIHSFDRMVKKRRTENNDTFWSDGEELYKWWIGSDCNQLQFDGFGLDDL